MRKIINVLKWMLIILFIVVSIIYFGVYPWIKSKFTADDVYVARKDQFVQLFSSAELEFMAEYYEFSYDAGGRSSNNVVKYVECGFLVYKLNKKTSDYLMETKGVKEINQYFDDKMKYQEDEKLNAKKKYINIKNLYLTDYDVIISYYKKNRIQFINSNNGFKKLNYNWVAHHISPMSLMNKKLNCIYDNNDYYRSSDYKKYGIYDYFATQLTRIYPYYFNFKSMKWYKKQIKDESGFYIVDPYSDMVYVLQPKHNRIFKLY